MIIISSKKARLIYLWRMKRITAIVLFLLPQYLLFSQTFTSTVNQAIPDDGTTISFPLEINGLQNEANGNFGLVEVCLNMNHPYDSDMDVRLKAPDGTVFMLFAGIGGDGDNWENCCLRQDANESIGAVAAPFSGTFKPLGNMGNLNNGQNPNGIWELVLFDTYAFADQGFLIDWSLGFGSGAATPTVFPGTHLPIVLIETGGQAIPDEPKILADLKIVNKGNGQLNQPSDLDFEFEGKILVELQGFTGPWYPKKNYDFDLVDQNGLEYDTILLGLPSENDWILKAEYLDPTLMSNAVAYEFARRMGRYAPRTMYCEVFVDGDYVGVYNLTEKVKRDKNRVDIAKLTPQDTVGEELTGGYIIEMNHNGDPGAWISPYLPINFNSCNLPVQYKYVEPRQTEIQPQQAYYIQNYVDSFEHSLHQPNFADPALGYRRFIDDSTFMDFMFVNEFSTNYDSYGRSTFMYKEKSADGGKLKLGPAWDYDRGYCCVEGWVWEITHPGWPFPDWWSIFHTDPAFLQQRHCRWQALRQGPWQTDAFLSMVDSLHLLLAEPAARNFERWPELGYADFDGNVAFRRNLIAERLAWMDGQITGGDCQATSTDEQVAEQWATLAPNPSSGFVRLSTKLGDGFQLRIFDVKGSLVLKKTLQIGQTDFEFMVSDWSPGLYVVELVNENVKWQSKLVVY